MSKIFLKFRDVYSANDAAGEFWSREPIEPWQADRLNHQVFFSKALHLFPKLIKILPYLTNFNSLNLSINRFLNFSRTNDASDKSFQFFENLSLTHREKASNFLSNSFQIPQRTRHEINGVTNSILSKAAIVLEYFGAASYTNAAGPSPCQVYDCQTATPISQKQCRLTWRYEIYCIWRRCYIYDGHQENERYLRDPTNASPEYSQPSSSYLLPLFHSSSRPFALKLKREPRQVDVRAPRCSQIRCRR